MPQTSRKVPTKIRCRRCATLNPPNRDNCRACGAGLPRRATAGPRPSILRRPIAKPIVRTITRPLSAVADAPIADSIKRPLKRVKRTSREVLSADLAMLEELWRNFARGFEGFAPGLPQAIERLAQLESHLVEITGLDSPAFSRQGAPINEELHWLRDRLHQAANDAESMLRLRHTRDMNQLFDSMTAGLRFIITAVGIVRLTLDMVDRLSPKRVVKRAFRGEAP